MPIPKREEGEEAQKFMGRCMTSEVMKEEYPEQKQRVAICMQSSRAEADKFDFQKMFEEELVYAEYEKDCECGEVCVDGCEGCDRCRDCVQRKRLD